MKTFDFTEELSEFVINHELENGQEIILELDGRRICRAIVIRDVDDIEFKVLALR